ncbi:MAG TPA: GNAT family N-acetyltransferase [Ilumatobacteraceae bacterium]|jgi:predicted acetyltransferase
MPISYRTATDSDWPAICRADGRAFGFTYEPERIESSRVIHDTSRYEIALDGSEVVGVAGVYSLEVTVPGGGQLPMGAITWVSTAATHRRQGVLTTLMGRSLADVDRRGEPVAMLYASEGGIYERYGFGIASVTRVASIDRRMVQLRPEFRPKPGSVRFLDGDAALSHIMKIWPRFHRLRSGEVDRTAAWHTYLFDQWKQPSGSFGPALFITHRDGYAVYRVESHWNDGRPAHTVRLVEFVATTRDAHAALWHTLLGIDLVATIVSTQIPIDDPLPYLLTDPRGLQTTTLNDGIWVNVRDVAACMSARRYGTDDRFVVEVEGVRWAIDGSASDASCTRVRTRADFVTDTASLGALLLGGVRPSLLAAGRRLEARNDQVLRRADAFFLTSPTPHCQTHY